MFRRGGASVALLAAALFAGCGHASARVDDAEVAKLPPPAQRTVSARAQEVDVARSNVVSAEAALDDAKSQRSRAGRQLRAADPRLRAAARAATTWADDVVRLRQARLDEARAELRLARAQAALTRTEVLREHGRPPRIDPVLLLDEQRVAADELGAARIAVADRDSAVESSRRAWARQTEEARAAASPPPAPTLPPPTPMAVPTIPPL
ncbi:MAG TPA: hypothetical protein VF334_04610 [Polyangia bacterium]